MAHCYWYEVQAFQKSRESGSPCHWVSRVSCLFSLLLKMCVELFPCAQATGWCSCVEQGGASFSRRLSGQSICSKCYEWTTLNSGWKNRRRKPKLLSVVQTLRQKVEGRGAGNSQESPTQRSWWPAGSSNEGCGREGWRLRHSRPSVWGSTFQPRVREGGPCWHVSSQYQEYHALIKCCFIYFVVITEKIRFTEGKAKAWRVTFLKRS